MTKQNMVDVNGAVFAMKNTTRNPWQNLVLFVAFATRDMKQEIVFKSSDFPSGGLKSPNKVDVSTIPAVLAEEAGGMANVEKAAGRLAIAQPQHRQLGQHLPQTSGNLRFLC